jgi:UDP-N-acetylmuramate dehydrogenase
VTTDRKGTPLEQLTAGLRGVLGPDAVLANEPLARHTALRIGGPADLLVLAGNLEELCRSVALAWELGIPCRVLGAGSNVLVSDAGVQGLVVLNRARAVSFKSPSEQGWPPGTPTVEADAGASLSTVARQCVVRGLAGLEWAATIPGTVGGAVVGNAGAWGGDVASTLLQAQILETSGEVVDWPVERFQYGYRASLLKQESKPDERRPVVLKAEFALYLGERGALEARVAEMVSQRKSRQPAGASCGSVFRNPPGDYAGRLIESAGLKGVSRGEAEISPVHANFIVNHGGAGAQDVRELIELARQQVQAQFGVRLNLEIQLIGRWPGLHSVSLMSGESRPEPAGKHPSQAYGPSR